MKFLLVKPHTALKVAHRLHAFLRLEPLDLEIVAGGIPIRHETRILDLALPRRPLAAFVRELLDFQPDVIGFTGYSNQAKNVKQLAKRAKAIRPRALTIVGGVHASIVPDNYRLAGVIDLVVRGEGGTALRRLSACLERGETLPADEIFLPVASPEFARLAALPPPELPPYEEVPSPRRELVDRSRYYCIWSGRPGERMETLFPRVAAVRTSTGCPHRCSFCVVHYLAHGKYLQRRPEDVADELAAVPESHIYFVDDEMFINRKRTEAIARLLIERGIRKHYISWARSDTICENPELFRLWKEAGLSLLYVGLESMDPVQLEGYRKGYTPDVNRRAVEILRGLGIALHGALMIHPRFSEEEFLSVRRTIEFLVPAEITFTVFSPPPGTRLWNECRHTFICEDPYTFYDCMHTLLPTALPLNSFYKHFSMLSLLAFRSNPWRMNRVRVPLRDIARLLIAGAFYGRSLRRIYRDYDRKLW